MVERLIADWLGVLVYKHVKLTDWQKCKHGTSLLISAYLYQNCWSLSLWSVWTQARPLVLLKAPKQKVSYITQKKNAKRSPRDGFLDFSFSSLLLRIKFYNSHGLVPLCTADHFLSLCAVSAVIVRIRSVLSKCTVHSNITIPHHSPLVQLDRPHTLQSSRVHTAYFPKDTITP